MTERVHRIASVALTVDHTVSLPFEQTYDAAINAHWANAVAEKPHMFDGRVHFAVDHRIEGDALTATCLPGRFATLLYWRDMGFPDTSFRHIFGDVIPRASDGALLLGKMSAHTANAGRVYFPGGAIDENDVRGNRIDIDHNIAREMEEELGLDPASYPFTPGYVVAISDVAIGVGRTLDLPWAGEDARARLLESAQTKGDGEIADVIVVRRPGDLDGLDVVEYAKHLVEALSPEA